MAMWLEEANATSSCDDFVEGIPDEMLSEPDAYATLDGDIQTG
jgi:hypothetical protein